MTASKDAIIADIEKNKIILILRGLTPEQLVRTVAAAEEGGIRLVEVTFDQSGAIPDAATAENIALLRRTFAGRIRVGAGTVLSVAQVRLAHAAGAEFIISPDTFEPVITETVRRGMVSIPGAMTPTECAMAGRYGADFVKLFPCGQFPPSYFKDLRAPLSHLRFLAVGGVTPNNISDYLEAGACGVGIASGIAAKADILNGDYAAVTARARAYSSHLNQI